MELCPAIRARVQASHPDSPKRVRNVCRNEYSTKWRTLLAFSAFACCFLMLEPSRCPVQVGAGHTQPSVGFPAPFQRLSRTALTLGVIGKTLRAAAVFPWVTKRLPCRPLLQVRASHWSRKHSSGRNPVSTRTSATEQSGSSPAAKYLACSWGVTTRYRCRAPGSILTLGEDATAPHSTARRSVRRRI
jgi:hypothetical protein